MEMTENLGIFLKQANAAYELCMTSDLKELGVSLPQMLYLSYIQKCGGIGVSVAQIERSFSVSPDKARAILDSLVGLKLLQQRSGAVNPQEAVLELTLLGKAKVSDYFARHKKIEQLLLSPLSMDERVAFLSALAKVAQHATERLGRDG